MSINKIYVFTIIASIVVFQIIQTCSTDAFTIDQFIGEWYAVGSISPTYDKSNVVTCYRVNITKINSDDESFHQTISLIINGDPMTHKGYGKIINSEVRVFFKALRNATSVYTVESYNSGNELILKDEIHERSYAIISRLPPLAVETKAKFEILAEHSNLEAVYFLHTGCPEIK